MLLPGKELEEGRLHSTAFDPYSFYECRLPAWFKDVPMHWHSEFELDYLVRGAGEFTCGGQRIQAAEGDVLLLPPNMLHACRPIGQEELRFYALVFSPALVGANQQDRCAAESLRPLAAGSRRAGPHIGPGAGHYREIRACAKEVFACVLGDLPHAGLLLKSALLRLFWLVETDEALCREDCAPQPESIRPALEYMLGHYQEAVTVGQLAQLCHMSKSYFMGSFKKAVGQGAIEYLLHLRVNAACEALARTGKKVSEIAFSCGYGNLSNFNRQFRQVMGCSPAQYRKQQRDGQ